MQLGYQNEMLDVVLGHELQSLSVDIEEHVCQTSASPWFRIMSRLLGSFGDMNSLFKGNFPELKVNLG